MKGAVAWRVALAGRMAETVAASEEVGAAVEEMGVALTEDSLGEAMAGAAMAVVLAAGAE